MTDRVYFQRKGFEEFNFLSNFYPSPMVLDGKEFATVEHYYQACKATNEKDFEYVRAAGTPGDARRRGREIAMLPGWELSKDEVMLIAVEQKFRQNPILRDMLLATEGIELVEFAPWGDVYWGVNKDLKGENHLGRALMMVREQFRKEEDDDEERVGCGDEVEDQVTPVPSGDEDR